MLGETQTITTSDGSIFPLTAKNRICYLEQRRPTVWEMKTLTRLVMTSVELWDPSTYDCTNNAHNNMNMMLLARSKRAMISETGEHRRYKNGKLMYKAGPHPYSQPTATRPIKKLVVRQR